MIIYHLNNEESIFWNNIWQNHYPFFPTQMMALIPYYCVSFVTRTTEAERQIGFRTIRWLWLTGYTSLFRTSRYALLLISQQSTERRSCHLTLGSGSSVSGLPFSGNETSSLHWWWRKLRTASSGPVGPLSFQLFSSLHSIHRLLVFPLITARLPCISMLVISSFFFCVLSPTCSSLWYP